MAHVRLDSVSVTFPIFTAHSRSLKLDVATRLGGHMAAHHRTIVVEAIKNLTARIEEGDRVGLIGHNGAGKTTFLRLVSGVYTPASGGLNVEGRLAAFTDLALGMDLEASGWDNITFRCIFMGLSFADARRLAPAIAEFSELGDYLDMPVRTYSTGMFVRLAFAISTSMFPDIVVMDEMISAGDQRFISKATSRIQELLDRSKILIIASHDLALIKSLCNRVFWLEKGRLRMAGDPQTVIESYQASIEATLAMA
jgi:ABC-type polysaccharide/polyol phosphate transport system ATPase subunit